MTSPLKIIVGGENLIDFVEHSSIDGMSQYHAIPGGSPFNVAIAAARQGGDVDYITPISTDRLGQLLSNHLINSGVNLTAERPDAPTSLAIVSLNHGQPSYQFYRNDTAERLIKKPALYAILHNPPWLFHIGSLALAEGTDAELWQDFFTICHQQGVITSLDPNVRPMLINDRNNYIQRLEAMFQYADIIKLSDEDMSWLYPDMSLTDAFQHLINISSKGLRVLTKGADGAVAVCGNRATEMAAHPVQSLVDTVGAGDTFMASILMWLQQNEKITEKSNDYEKTNLKTGRDAILDLSGESLKAMMKYAAKAAAMNCEKQGCNPPSREELLK